MCGIAGIMYKHLRDGAETGRNYFSEYAENVPDDCFILTLGLLTATAALTVDLSLPAIPSMVVALESTLTHGQQIVGIFMAGMAVGQIPAGLFSDRLGRMPTLYAGMTLFAIAATVAAASNEMEWLLAARFVQGIGAASAVVLSRAIVRDIASGQEAARLMSLMTMIFTAAPVIAPTLGALLVTQWAGGRRSLELPPAPTC